MVLFAPRVGDSRRIIASRRRGCDAGLAEVPRRVRGEVSRVVALDSVAALPYLYLTTTGRKTGLPREIEIWFVVYRDSFYIFAEGFRRAQWVKNIAANPRVEVRVGNQTLEAAAAALDEARDAAEWRTVQDLARAKYGWGDGLPVRIRPL